MNTLIEPWSARVVTTAEAGTPEWLAAHRGLYGGPDVASILGVGYETPLQVWAKHTGKVEREDLSQVPWIQDGHDFEPVIVARFARVTGRQVLPCPGLVRSPKVSYIAATTDRLQTQEGTELIGVLETKSLGFQKAQEFREGAVDRFEVQVQVEMHVLGLDWGSVAGLPLMRKRDDPCVLYRDVVLDPVFEQYMLDRVGTFHERHVLADTPPPAMQDDHDTLRRIYPREVVGEVKDLPGNLDALWLSRAEIKRELSANEEAIAAIDAEIKQFMGTAQWARGSGYALRWAMERYGAREAGESRKLRQMKEIK